MALSNCHDFENYPTIGDPVTTSQPVSCAAWNCDGDGFYGYWFGHLPANPGCAPDGAANNWWRYFARPALALNPPAACY